MTTDLDDMLDTALEHLDDIPNPTGRPAPFVTALRAGDLFADDTYQRELDQLRVEKMAAAFDTTLLGVLEVADRGDGRYAILDGQHRWAAARDAHPSHDDAHLVCQVHRGLTVAEEARVFYDVDVRRRALTGWDRWKARRGAGDPDVLAIERVVAEAHLRVDPASRDGNVSATKALEDVWQLGGEPLLASTLTVLRLGYGAIRDAFDGQMIAAAATVLSVYDRDELDVDRFTAQLQTMPPRAVKARAQALREAHRGTLPRLTAAVMVERYNAGPGRKLEELLTRISFNAKLAGNEGRRNQQLAMIRRWAEKHGHSVPKTQTPARLIAAYTDAHPGFRLAAR